MSRKQEIGERAENQEEQSLGEILSEALARQEEKRKADFQRQLRQLDLELAWAVAGIRPENGIWH